MSEMEVETLWPCQSIIPNSDFFSFQQISRSDQIQCGEFGHKAFKCRNRCTQIKNIEHHDRKSSIITATLTTTMTTKVSLLFLARSQKTNRLVC